MEALERRQRQFRQVEPLLHRRLDRGRHHLVRVAEGQALLHQVVGEVGRGRVAAPRGALHGVGLDHDAARAHAGRGVGFAVHHLGEDAQRVAQRVDGVEQRLLVLLVVLVVGQRLALHQRQQRHQVADHAPGLAAREFGDAGVALLRHDRAAGAVAVGEVDEAEGLAHPQHQFLGQPRHVHHADRREGRELEREVAVADRVQAVVAQAVEAERARHAFAIERVTGAGQRRGPERQAVDPPPQVGEAFGVAREHLDVGQQVVREAHRLSHLQVGETGHHGLDVPRRELDQRALQVGQARIDAVDLAAQPQPDVGRDLVVAAAPGVQPLARVADELRQPGLDVQVHILEFELPLEAAGLDLARDLLQAAPDVGQVLRADDVLGGQHLGVRQAAVDVGTPQPPVEADARGVAMHQLAHRFGEQRRPGLGFVVEGVGGHAGSDRALGRSPYYRRAMRRSPSPEPSDAADLAGDDATRPASVWPASTRPADLGSTDFAATHFDPLLEQRAERRRHARTALDVCAPMLALRVVLFVQVALGVGVLLAAEGAADWLPRQAAAMYAGVAGSGLWLVAVCALRLPLARLGSPQRLGALLGVGAAAAWIAWGPLLWVGLAVGGAVRAAG